MNLNELKLSKTELNILRILQDDPDRPRKLIAKDAGVSEATLSKLIKKIKEAGGIRRMNVLILNPLKFGMDALAFFRVLCEYRSVESVTQAVALMTEVQEIHQNFGAMDSLILKVRSRNNTDLSQIQGRIGSLEGVREVRVDPVISKKEETDLPI